MTTWAELLSDIRSDLQDTNATSPRWSDGEIYVNVKDAIRDYSLWFPRQLDRVEIVAADGGYALPTDFIAATHVENPLDTYLEKRGRRPGVRYRLSFSPKYYTIIAGTIKTSNVPADGEILYLSYDAVHPVPASAEDITFDLTVPDIDIELIRLFVRGRLFTKMRGKQASLDRFKVGGGKRDDNPISDEVEDLMRDYRDAIATRYRGGAVSLYRVGRVK
jgi:hypothetical protein